MERVLITGANRGIGLALTKRCLERGDQVFAACRDPQAAEALHRLADQHDQRLVILPLEVTDEASIDAAAAAVEAAMDGLDLLFNNAGIAPQGERLGGLDAPTMLHTLHVNTVAPVLVAQRFLELLRQGRHPRIVNVTSQLGSLARKQSAGSYSYSSSKAALNMVSKALAFDLKPEGIIVVMIHPGWVQTDMGGQHAPVMPGESARGILDVVDQLTIDDTARFLDWMGRQLPW